MLPCYGLVRPIAHTAYIAAYIPNASDHSVVVLPLVNRDVHGLRSRYKHKIMINWQGKHFPSAVIHTLSPCALINHLRSWHLYIRNNAIYRKWNILFWSFFFFYNKVQKNRERIEIFVQWLIPRSTQKRKRVFNKIYVTLLGDLYTDAG